MSFVAVRFLASAASAESWADALLASGALAVDTADGQAGSEQEVARYGEPGNDPGTIALWPVCRMDALFAENVDVDRVLAGVSAALGAPVPAHTIAAVADNDWVSRTQDQFQPVCISARLWIVPTWCETVDVNAINLRLDPGLAFGTGTHPTTRLCLRWLASLLGGGETVLDYGCGSGILAIAAAKMGAAEVDGIDLDPQAIAASRNNARLNGVEARFDLPDAIPCRTYDIVVANILANPLRLLAPLLARRVRSQGNILLSGILRGQAADVMAAYRRWFTIDVWNSDDEWVALAGSRMVDNG